MFSLCIRTFALYSSSSPSRCLAAVLLSSLEERGETIAAEDILHDMGAISAMSSDSQAMGRVGEVITRTWQTADKVRPRSLWNASFQGVSCPLSSPWKMAVVLYLL